MKSQVNGLEFEYGVNESNGEFSTVVNGVRLRSSTLKGLKASVQKAAATKVWNIPFVEVDERFGNLTYTYGVITGRSHNGRHFTCLCKGETSVSSIHLHDTNLLKGDADIKKLNRLYRAKEEAQEAYVNFKHECALDCSALPDKVDED